MRHKSLLSVLLVVFSMLMLLPSGCTSSKKPVIVVFYKDDCPDCRRMKESLQNLLAAHPDLVVAYYNMDDIEAQKLLRKLSPRYKLGMTTSYDVPVILVGETAIVRAGRTQEIELAAAIKACVSGDCPSPLR